MRFISFLVQKRQSKNKFEKNFFLGRVSLKMGQVFLWDKKSSGKSDAFLLFSVVTHDFRK